MPGIGSAVAIGGNRNDPHIDAEPIVGLEFLGLGHVARTGKIPLAANEAQVGLAFTEGQELALVRACHRGDFDPPLDGPDRKHVRAEKPENAIVVRLSGVGPENRSSGFVDLESIGDFGDAADSRLSGHVEIGAGRGVGELVERELPKDSIVKALGRDCVASRVAFPQRLFEDCGLFAGGQQFDRGDELHVSYIEQATPPINQ